MTDLQPGEDWNIDMRNQVLNYAIYSDAIIIVSSTISELSNHNADDIVKSASLVQLQQFTVRA